MILVLLLYYQASFSECRIWLFQQCYNLIIKEEFSHLCVPVCCSMKRRRLLLSAPLLPTITETLEDLPAPSTSSQSSPSLEDYMTSIQALARPVEAPSHNITRFQRSPRTRHFTKGQMKLSASPRILRTSRSKARDYSLSGNITEEHPLKMGRDCREKDPIDWLFGQIRTWESTETFNERF